MVLVSDNGPDELVSRRPVHVVVIKTIRFFIQCFVILTFQLFNHVLVIAFAILIRELVPLNGNVLVVYVLARHLFAQYLPILRRGISILITIDSDFLFLVAIFHICILGVLLRLRLHFPTSTANARF